jgi:hypothetical protein
VNNLALCESISLREEQLKEVSQDRALEILDKAKALVMAIHQGVGVATTEEVAKYFEVSIEAVSKVVQRHRSELNSDGLKVIQGKILKEHKDLMSLCDGKARLITWNPRSMLRCGMLLRDSEVAKQVRTTLLDIASNKNSVENLERQFLPEMSLKQIDEYATIMGKRFGAAYEQQVLIQTIQKFYPDFPIIPPKPEELASLITAKALLNPTQIAKELGLLCKAKPYNPSGEKANKLLEQLGYQIKISGTWSATDKAIDANLVDRKPVSTGSSTQKDQMRWSADIIPILQEYTVSAQQTLDLHARNR